MGHFQVRKPWVYQSLTRKPLIFFAGATSAQGKKLNTWEACHGEAVQTNGMGWSLFQEPQKDVEHRRCLDDVLQSMDVPHIFVCLP